ncbi:MAG: aldehyde dehydrogenase family protein [Bdellovibrionales bacterium]|nr:aldehyde dehydrogenase family protein [Bdellovibrionales bacterium]
MEDPISIPGMNAIEESISEQRKFFLTGQTLDIAFRIQKLKNLLEALREFEGAFFEALQKDLGKHPFESYATEIALCRQEIFHAIKSIKSWSKPKRVSTPWHLWPARSKYVYQPKGVALIIGPWNYPMQLIVCPLIASIAAGNCSILKPSELAPNVSAVLKQMIQKYFLREYVDLFEGGPETNQILLKQNVDHIFFTGGPRVGRIVMRAAAENLTPVTLELGGKSPCFIDTQADPAMVSRRIVFGKFMNVGQTCIAPDYLLIPETMLDTYLEKLKLEIERQIGPKPLESPEWGKIVNRSHYDRLKHYLDSGAKIVHGGKFDDSILKMEPTLVVNPKMDSPLMTEEIFGPICPIVTYKDIDDALEVVERNPNPLSVYIFSHSRRFQERIIRGVNAGGVCVNDTLVHMIVPDLPFGGVRQSGIGAYHGFHGFSTFSHRKAILKRTFFFDISLRYRPYGNKLKLLKRVL